MRILPYAEDRVKVLVSGALSSGATSILLNSGQGALLPDPASVGEYRLVLFDESSYNDPTDDPNVENVTITAKTSDTLTCNALVNNHTASGVQLVMFLSFDAQSIDTVDDFLRDMGRQIDSITYDDDNQIQVITTPYRTYTFTWTVGRLDSITTNDSPAKTLTFAYDGSDRIISVTLS